MILQNQSRYLKKNQNYTGIPIRTQAQSGYIPSGLISAISRTPFDFTFQSGYIPIPVRLFVVKHCYLYIPPLCQVLDTFFLSEIAFLRSRFLIALALHLFIVKFLHLET